MIYAVGMGPGASAMMTEQARSVLESCHVIVGYTVYIDLLKPLFPHKEFASTPMRQEVERCRLCFEYALEGRNVAMVCSGDAGVYGMAAPLLEIQNETPSYKDIDVCVIPGITAANSGAALLGAPLNHDYCVISLSDLLTPWETIEKRLKAAVFGDFAIAIYNPASHKRHDHLKKACRIMMEAGAEPDRACGWVENIGRDDTRTKTCTLAQLEDEEVNMFSTVFIGNSGSFIMKDGAGSSRLVTRRGYSL